MSIDEKSELEDFLAHILGDTFEANKSFVDKLINYKKLCKIKKESGGNIVVYKKFEEPNHIESKTKTKSKNKTKLTQQGTNASDKPMTNEAEKLKEQSVRKKAHYVPLYNQDCDQNSILLPGRHVCTCEASKHQLINNCLHCGRIVCKQEGSGPCLTCGALVCTPQEQEIILRGSKKSVKLHETLMRVPNPEADAQLKKAIDHKNKLLEFNRTSAQRTQVIDDESDYFSLDGNKWMTKDQRQVMAKKVQELHDKRHASRSAQKVTFDIAGRRIIDADGSFDYQRETDDLKALAANFSSLKFSSNEQEDLNVNINPSLDIPSLVYEPTRYSKTINKSEITNNRWNQPIRIQDRELQEITDKGMCLSLHQPWASLLVMGIKTHEGRTWYTHYRGLLWIHAASKVPTPREVAEVEESHKLIHRNSCAKFPEQYPVSCLLGCLTLTDCLPQEEYKTQFPEGESASPYVFICENPQELLLKFPMKGKHKIFKMESNIHKAAKNILLKLVEK